ncbi:dihydroxyacetone kinase subunit DhaK [Sagittula stellata]|uniref:Dihydroxyacetone kinase protein n=1 Tax=Sagittula stellata (strain ATCC 700073 / DSM 11524 / E-37) TaxID=388399 RepID=A3K4I4_SAGS3|nr:dihydroxyacetone kinase subunit DhaK [Sagittula stellata]EBA07883.1 dihydroxyacetone kinase protein [Sagittula stellata E-37]
MAQFINRKQDIVQDAINGLVAASNGRLVRLDGYPFVRVVLRSDWDRRKVAIVSGGGSGHEPAHAGFVGKGMLTAAVCGDVFASPSVDAILAGIVAVTGPAGCLLIVKSYTGDRLNFGLAAARAREMGLRVSMVVVGDDFALPDISSPRGIAGTLFVHKIAGAVAEADGDLAEATQAAECASAQAISIGMALSSCTVPGARRDNRIADGDIELGLGIHGEPGAEQIPFLDARKAMADVLAKMEPRLGAGTYVALVNNLGGTTTLEMLILLDALRTSAIGSKITQVIGPAAMMTALDMHGFSISLYPLSTEDTPHLEAPTEAPGWMSMKTLGAPGVVALPDLAKAPTGPASWHAGNARMLKTCCRALIEAEEDLNYLDARTGDGDTGTTVAIAARALLERLQHLPLSDLTQLFRAISQELTQTMGGSSGILLAILFSAAAEACAEGLPVTEALRWGLHSLQDIGGAKPGDRTMIDAFAPALERLEDGLVAAAEAARSGAESTSFLTVAGAGRSSYVRSDQLRGNNDPGAEAVARLFEALSASEHSVF